jgi:hypothetical protein
MKYDNIYDAIVEIIDDSNNEYNKGIKNFFSFLKDKTNENLPDIIKSTVSFNDCFNLFFGKNIYFKYNVNDLSPCCQNSYICLYYRIFENIGSYVNINVMIDYNIELNNGDILNIKTARLSNIEVDFHDLSNINIKEVWFSPPSFDSLTPLLFLSNTTTLRGIVNDGIP